MKFQPFILFVTLALVEASVRKYFISSPLVVLLKYIFVLAFIPMVLKKPHWYPLAMVFLTAPLLFLLPDIQYIGYAFYDIVSILLVPLLIFGVAKYPSFLNSKTTTSLIPIIAFGGILHSLIVILQCMLGPSHWLSVTVNQSAAEFTWGLAHKAPGIAGVSSPYISIAGLTCIQYIISRPQLFSKTLIYRFSNVGRWLIYLSALFNLPSRGYVFGILLFSLISATVELTSRKKSSYIYVLIFMAGLIMYFLLQENAENWGINSFQGNRSFEDFDSASSRFGNYFTTLFSDKSMYPLFGGPGLGATVNGSPLNDVDRLPPQCSQLILGEGEYDRFLCAFGFFGVFHILIRMLLGLQLLLIGIKAFLLRETSRASGLLFVGYLVFAGAFFKQNDAATGIILITVACSAISTHASQSELPEKSQTSTSPLKAIG